MSKSKIQTKPGKQEKLFEEVNDPPLLRAADRVIELREEKTIVGEKLEVQENNLIGLMQKAGKEKIRHGGYLIQIRLSEAKNKISLKPIPQNEIGKTKKGEEIENSTRRENEKP